MTSQDDSFDIFISYARADNADGSIDHFVHCLKEEYNAAFPAQPLRIFFDTIGIEAGEDWNTRIHISLKNSRVMVALLSENYIQSYWCRKEWRIWCEVERSRGWLSNMLFPLYYTPIDNVEERIASHTRHLEVFSKNTSSHASILDLETKMEKDACLSDLFSRQLVNFFHWKDTFKNDNLSLIREFVKTVHKKIQLAINAEQGSSNFVRANPYFSGRIQELKSIRSCFAQPQKGLVPVIHGIGGEGKTALAIAYGHAFAYDYPGGRFLVHCEGLQSLEDCFYRLAEEQGLQLSASQASMLPQVWQWLQNRPHGRCLVILDYIDSRELLAEGALSSVIRADDKVHVLATTRCDCHNLGHTAVPISLGNLFPLDSLYLLSLLRPFRNEEKQAVINIIQFLGGHALSLQLAGAFLRENSDVTYADFADELMDEGMLAVLEQTSEAAINIDYKAFSGIAKLILPTLEKCNEEEKTALQLIALLAPEGVIGSWICESLQILFPKSMRKKGLKDPWGAMVRKFSGLCLWQAQDNKNIFHMHRLVREVIRNYLTQKEKTQSYYEILHDVALEKADEYILGTSSWPLHFFHLLLPTLSLWFSQDQYRRHLICLPEVLTGKILRGTGRDAECIQLATNILNFLHTLPENPHVHLLSAALLSSRGQSFLAQGFVDKALHDYNRALELLDISTYCHKPSVIHQKVACLDFAGEAERSQGNSQQALALHTKSLQILNDALENNIGDSVRWEIDRCYTLDHLARTQEQLHKNSEQALEYYLSSLHYREKLCQEHANNERFLRDYANSCDFVGEIYAGLQGVESSASSSFTTAQDFFAKALEIREKLHEKDKKNTTFQRDLSISYNNTGRIFLKDKKIQDATVFFAKALTLRKEMLEKDEENPLIIYDYSLSLLNMGDVYLAQDMPEKALEYYQNAVEIRHELCSKFSGKASFFYGLAVAYDKCAKAHTTMQNHSLTQEALQHTVDALKSVISMKAEDSPQRKALEADLLQISQKILPVEKN